MPPPEWVAVKIRRLISSSSGRLSFSQAASEIGRHGASKRHHRNGHTYRSPKERETSQPAPAVMEQKVEEGTQLGLGLQLQTRYF